MNNIRETVMRNASFINPSNDQRQRTVSNNNILQLKNGNGKLNNDSSFAFDDKY